MLRRLGFAAQIANPPPGMAELIDDFLAGAQTQLFLQYPQLETERFFSWTSVADERFYDIAGNDEQTAGSPCTKVLDPKKITWVGIEDGNGSWVPLSEGIDPTLYTSADNSGKPYCYEIRQELEVFPAPEDTSYTIWIKGHFGLLPFTDDGHVTSIEPEVVFLLALAGAKAHYNQPDAQLYFTQATNRVGKLTAGLHGTARYVPRAGRPPPLTKPVLLPLP